jgi:aminopeptidase N
LKYFSLILLFLSFFCSCEIKEKEADYFEPGVSIELAKIRTEQFSKLQYRLHFVISQDKSAEIHASINIGFKLSPTSAQHVIIDFNADGNAIKSVKSGNSPLSYELENEHIILNIDDFELGAWNEITIEFTAGETGLNRFDEYIYTLLVPDRASTVFPCFDQPDLKATFELSLDISEDWVAVTNGKKGFEKLVNGRKSIGFEKSDYISTYLFSFVAGKFETITYDGWKMPMTLYHRETDTVKVNNNAAEIFKLHQHSLEWLEEYTGIDYPFKKFDFVLIPGFQYGGMEHVGAIQYKASSLLLESNATTNQQLSRASLIAHETAHMWFGDLVTMRWFDDVWMKEVFANFMAAKIMNPFFPEINHDQKFLLAHYPGAYAVDRSKGTHPIRQPLENLKQAGSLYGPIIYQKAPIVMRMLEQKLGENNFKIGLREYLETYAYKAASWPDLIAILDDKTTDNLAHWSEVWVETAGMPIFQLSYVPSFERNTLQIIQKSIQLDQPKVWSQTFMIEMNYEDSNILNPISFNDQPAAFLFQNERTIDPISISLNPTGMAYGTFDFGDSINLNTYPFGYPLLNISSEPEPIKRSVLYLQLYEYYLLKRKYPANYPIMLERFIFRETDKLNTSMLLGHIENVFWRWMPAAQRESYAKRYEFMLQDLIEKASDKGEKADYFNTLISIAQSEELLALLYKIWESGENDWGMNLTESDFIKMSEILALKMPKNAEEIISKQITKITNPDNKERLKFIAPALSGDVAVRNDFFERLKLKENRVQESWVGEALGYLHHPLRSESAIPYIMPSLELLEEIQLTGDIFFPSRWLHQTFWGHQNKAVLDSVNSFLSGRPNFNPRLKNKILQSVDILERTIEMRSNMEK